MIHEWSGHRDSNPGPQPWEGRALPTELCPQYVAPASPSSSGAAPQQIVKDHRCKPSGLVAQHDHCDTPLSLRPMRPNMHLNTRATKKPGAGGHPGLLGCKQVRVSTHLRMPFAWVHCQIPQTGHMSSQNSTLNSTCRPHERTHTHTTGICAMHKAWQTHHPGTQTQTHPPGRSMRQRLVGGRRSCSFGKANSANWLSEMVEKLLEWMNCKLSSRFMQAAALKCQLSSQGVVF